MKYIRKQKPIRYYPLICFVKKEELEEICRIFGLNPKRIRNEILASKEMEELTFEDWQKIMQEKPKKNL